MIIWVLARSTNLPRIIICYQLRHGANKQNLTYKVFKIFQDLFGPHQYMKHGPLVPIKAWSPQNKTLLVNNL